MLQRCVRIQKWTKGRDGSRYAFQFYVGLLHFITFLDNYFTGQITNYIEYQVY